ncbi:MAG: hypothetical protein HKN35_03670 [Woeseia sp.]|nr:hypothetical protein [Woeseia sp.]MBT8096944.1 hypothetical protein [Woeseia sp.]NNE59966.1 hypothetical protein [Woeseia sp.]NNL55650.1 hypothetical protein [Woeseia sp.]
MSANAPIRVFVSHLFTKDADYLRFFEFLESMDRFFYLNCSNPDKNPGGGLEAMKEELLSQIKEAEAVVIIAQHFTENPELVSYQLDVADANQKPVLVLRPFGGVVETPPVLAERGQEVLTWNEREIADALRRHARLEDTSRWDVIDFP